MRGHLAEFGLVAPEGPANLKLLENAVGDEAADSPGPVREMGTVCLERIANLTEAISSQDGAHGLGRDDETRGLPNGVTRAPAERRRGVAARSERLTRSRRYGLRSSRQGHSDPRLKRLQLSELMRIRPSEQHDHSWRHRRPRAES